MREKRSVWVIEQGSYSDYHVVGVYSSKESAEMVMAKLAQNNTPTIVKWTLDPGVAEISAGLSPYQVCMAMDGTVERCEPTDRSSYGIQTEVSVWQRTKAPAYRHKQNVQDAISGTVFARDRDHAVKIVNEKRIQYLAGVRP